MTKRRTSSPRKLNKKGKPKRKQRKAQKKRAKAAAKAVITVQSNIAMGRPSDWDPALLPVIRILATNGSTEFEIAQFLGIDPNKTMWDWKAKYPEFRKALELGIPASVERAKKALYHRGIGYSHKEVELFFDKEAGRVIEHEIVKHYPPDPKSLQLWLINKDPDGQWTEKGRTILELPPGGALPVTQVPPREELLETYYARLEATGVPHGADPRVVEHVGPDGREGDEPQGHPPAGPRR